MEIGEIISDSLSYPSQDWKKVLILGILFLISFLIIPAFLVMGYFFRILKGSIAGFEELPDFEEWGEMFIDGLKLFIVQIVYFLIPAIVILIGIWASFASISTGYISDPTAFIGIMGVTAIIGIILALILGLVANIAISNMALNNGELGAAFRFSEILEQISTIGWGKYIVWYIVMIVIGIIGLIIARVLNIIPFIGTIIALLTVYPYLNMFAARSLSLLYSSSVNIPARE